jgi:hypothetical protein
VLLDSTAPEPGPVPPPPARSSVADRVFALVPAVAHLGVGRALNSSSSYDELPPEVRDSLVANKSTARSLGSWLEEFRQGSASIREAALLTDLGDRPLVVLTADTGHDAGWQSDQQQLARLSTNSVHRSAHATHDSLVRDQDDSTAASQAVADGVVAARTGRSLTQR